MQFYKCSLPEISADKENEREAREIGGLGAKPPAGSRGRASGNTAASSGVNALLCCYVVDTRVL